MDKKKIIISIVIFIFIAAGIGYSVIKNKQPKYKFWVARKGEIIQKVSATGKVSPKKEIDLGFEIQGKIKKINIKVGDKAEKGQVLVSLDKDELNSQFLEAKANFESAKANLDKVQAGPSQEEIKIYEQAVKNARIALDNAETTLKDAEKTLADTKAQAKQNLDQAYQDALVVVMNKEKAAYKLYTSLAKMAPTEETKSLFQKLALEEANHKLQFETEYDDNIMKDN